MDGKDSKLHANHLRRYGRMHWDIELMTYWLEKNETTKTHVEKPQQWDHQKPPRIPLQTLWECCGSTWMCLLQYDLIARVWLVFGSQKVFLQMMLNVLVDYCLVFIFLGWRHVHLQVRKHFAGEFTLTLGFGWLWSFPSFRRRHGLHWMFGDNLDASHTALENAAYTKSKCHPKQRLVDW